MTTNQPESLESRLNRLETIFADMGAVVVAQSEAINDLTINVNRLTEQSYNFAEQTNQNINLLAQQAERDRQAWLEQAAADRQQAAIDRQAWQTEIQRIWEYLLHQGGNGHNG